MRTIDGIIMKYKSQILPNCSEEWEIICKETAKEYAKQQAIEFGKLLGLKGISYIATLEDEQWEWLDRAGELNYDSTERIYDMFISNDPKYRI